MQFYKFLLNMRGSNWLRGMLWNKFFSYLPGNKLRIGLFKFLFNAKFGHRVLFWKGIKVDGVVDSNIEIGDDCQLVKGLLINCSAGLKIGSNVFFGHDVSLYGADHDPDLPGMPARYAPVSIGDNVWIASKASVLKGVTIGEGAVVAYAAVVTKNIPPLAISAGVPARVIRYRNLSKETKANPIE